MNRNSVFISYSHLDKFWIDEIRKYLRILELNHQMIVWDDSKIKVGTNWKSEITQAIKHCRVAVLLVSSNFIASEFIAKSELPNILKAASKDGIRIFNVIIDVCTYQLTPLQVYQCLNNPDYPLEDLETRDRKIVLVKLATELLNFIKDSDQELLSKRNGNMVADTSISFSNLLVLAYLRRSGAKPITDIQNALVLKRKGVVADLELLASEGWAEKYNGTYNKKPSSLWKVTKLGEGVFDQFSEAYDKILKSTV